MNSNRAPHRWSGWAIVLSLSLIVFASASASAAVIRVPADAPTIQAGIDEATDGDTVLLANGRYTGEGNRDLDFGGRAITVTSAHGPHHCIIDCGGTMTDMHGGFILHSGEGRNAVIEGLTIRNGWQEFGGAISCENSSPTIRGNVIEDNRALYGGGGIRCTESSALISGNVIRNNGAGYWESFSSGYGGGIYCWGGEVTIEHNLIEKNLASGWGSAYGGGVYCSQTSHVITGCSILGNYAGCVTYTADGGGICCYEAELLISDSIVRDNDVLGLGKQIIVMYSTAVATITFSDVSQRENDTATYSYGTYEWGDGVVDEDPLFVTGPYGDSYLSQAAAGQETTSPCVDAGDPGSTPPGGTTRTDSAVDVGRVDMGYHFPIPVGDPTAPDTFITSGPEGAVDTPSLIFTYTGQDDTDPPEVLLFSWRLDDDEWSAFSPDRSAQLSFLREGSHTFFVRSRDTDGLIDTTPAQQTFHWSPYDASPWGTLVTGPGPGPNNFPLVRTGQDEWFAYGNYRFGVNVACGDIDGDGSDEVITGPGPAMNQEPWVKCWQPDGSSIPPGSFLAYGAPHWGVNVAAGDLDGNGTDEIITGAGPGAVYGPHVRGWRVGQGNTLPLTNVNFLAYGTLRWGVNVACGDLDGDGTDEIVTGAGPGAVFGPHVRGWNVSGSGTNPMPEVSFMAYGTHRWGVNVACGDLDGDGMDEIITGPGPGAIFGAHVRGWNYDGGAVAPMPGVSFMAYGTLYGAVVAAGDVDQDGRDELLTMPGPAPGASAHLRVFSVSAGKVIPLDGFRAYDPWMTYGGTVACGRFD